MKTKTSEELIEEVEALSIPQQRVVLEFVHFLRVKDTINPHQAYFVTRQWQRWEREAARAKVKGKLVGDGTVRVLLKVLKAKP